MTSPSARRDTTTASDIRGSRNTAGGLWSLLVAHRLAEAIAAWSARRKLTPTQLTLVGGVLGIATGVGVCFLHNRLIIAATLGLIGWQVSYVIDCADGQLARFQGSTSAEGALLDVLMDFIVQVGIVAAVSVFEADSLETHYGVLIGAVLASGFLLAIFDSTAARLLLGPTYPVSATWHPWRKIVVYARRTWRDHGLVVVVIPIMLATNAMTVLLVYVTALGATNLLFVGQRIVRLSSRSCSKTGAPKRQSTAPRVRAK